MSRSKKPDRIRTLDRALHRAAEADRRLRQAAAHQLGVGESDLDALLVVDELGALAAGRIAEALALTTGAVTGLVDRLERQGWVQRTRHDADRRQVLVELVPARRAAIAAHRAFREQALLAAAADHDDAEVAIAAALVDAAAEQLVGATAELGARATEDRPDAAPDAGDRAPIGSLEQATLRFSSGVARLALRGGRIRDLYRATFHGRRPAIVVDPDGVVTVRYKGLSWFAGRDDGAELVLTTAVRWSIEINRGVSHLDADLRELDVRAIDITGGANESQLRLPRPRGSVVARFKGGANRVAVRRPRGVPVQAIIRGGAHKLELDDQHLGAIGTPARLATPGWNDATDRWSIELTGGASQFAVTEE